MANTRIACHQLYNVLRASFIGGTSAPQKTRCLLRHISSSSVCRQNGSNSAEASQSSGPTPPHISEQEVIQYTTSEQQSSQDDREEMEHEHSVKQRILKASMSHVNDCGWTKQALEAGAVSEGLPSVAQGMFPRGGAELINYFYSQSNTELGEILAQKVKEAKEEGLEKPKTTALIRDALEIRLRMILPYIDKWPQAMAIQTLPQNAMESWSNLLDLSDEIWYHAGDRSVDFNWYTKRLTLAGVYKTSEIFMLQDQSFDKQDTWAFVDRRLADVKALGSSRQTVEQTSEVLKESLKGLCIVGRNIFGANSRDR